MLKKLKIGWTGSYINLINGLNVCLNQSKSTDIKVKKLIVPNNIKPNKKTPRKKENASCMFLLSLMEKTFSS